MRFDLGQAAELISHANLPLIAATLLVFSIANFVVGWRWQFILSAEVPSPGSATLLKIVFVGLQDVHPPVKVADAYQAVIGAEQEAQAKILQAQGIAQKTVLLAQAYPRSAILGSDYHQASVDTARKHAADAGLADRARFEVASAQTFSGTGYDLVATFDCLHDMGDPVGAARHIRQALAADGTWLIVEPVAGDTLAENLNPVSRVYYSFSTFICVPAARSQPGGYSLGSQAGEEAIREVTAQAGFSRFRRAEQTPFNAVYEARP